MKESKTVTLENLKISECKESMECKESKKTLEVRLGVIKVRKLRKVYEESS